MEYQEKVTNLSAVKETLIDLKAAFDDVDEATMVAALLMRAYQLVKGGNSSDDELVFVAEELSGWMAAVTAERKH